MLPAILGLASAALPALTGGDDPPSVPTPVNENSTNARVASKSKSGGAKIVVNTKGGGKGGKGGASDAADVVSAAVGGIPISLIALIVGALVVLVVIALLLR